MEESARNFAVIDIGSNSTRLMLASKQGGRFLVQEKKLRNTRLGEKIASQGALSEEGVARTINAVAEFLYIAKGENAEAVYAFATSAVRDGSNREEFLGRCRREFDLEVEVLDGRTEALVAYMGAVPHKNPARLIDIGGGSTELMAGQDGKILAAGSIPMGAVRAREEFLQDKAGFDRLYKALGKIQSEYWESKNPEKRELSGQRLLQKIKRQKGSLYGVGGTITTLCALSDGVSRFYDPRAVQGRTMTRGEITLVLRELDAMPEKERKALPLLQGREDIIRHGAVILMACMDALGEECVVVSDRDNLEGYLMYRLRMV